MTERIDVANLALSWIGANNITALTDDSDEARQVTTNYVPARDATLEAHDWSFAMERFNPAKSVEEPVWGFVNQFPIPSNIMRVVSVGPNKEIFWDFEQDQWVVESGFIMADVDEIFCRGIRRIEDEGIYSSLFVHLFAAKLAVLMAYPLTASNQIFKNMALIETGMEKQAKSRDGLQGRTHRIRNRSMQKARSGLIRDRLLIG